MASVNKVTLIGNIGKDPEVRYLEGGVAVAKFPLATAEAYKDKNGNKVESTEWHNIVLWRGLAEVAEKYFKKGMQLYVEGKLRTRSWDDKDGHKHYITEIVADNALMLGKRDSSAGSQHTDPPTPQQNPPSPASGNSSTDDLPF